MLTAEQIGAAIADGAIVCTPAPPDLATPYLPLHLGRYYWKPRSRSSIAQLLNGFHVDATARKVTPNVVVETADPIHCYALYDRHDTALTIGPHALIVGHSHEAVATVPSLHPQVHPYPKLFPWGLTLDIGVQLHGIWTLILYNRNEWAVTLPAGAQIAQVVFTELDAPISADQAFTPHEWTPEHMLAHMQGWGEVA